MKTKSYDTPETEPVIAGEPAMAYSRRDVARNVSADSWNPNVPFHGTQEEWWEHFHRIEEGNFMTIEEADEKFEIWKKKFLASRM
jgi:hypothetical protein